MLGNDCLQDVVPGLWFITIVNSMAQHYIDERQTEIQENVDNFDQLALIQGLLHCGII